MPENKASANLVDPASGAIVAQAESNDKDAPAKARNLGKLGDVSFSVPPSIKVFLAGKANAQGVKPGPIKATVGFATYTVMTPGGLHDLVAVIGAIRLPDKIDADGTKRQQVTYEVRFGSVGFDAEQMVATDKSAHKAWADTLIDGFRAWRKSAGITPPALNVGTAGTVYDE